MKYLWIPIAVFGIVFWSSLITSCGTAQGSGSTAVSFQGPNGTTCYVVYDSGRAVGGNCQ